MRSWDDDDDIPTNRFSSGGPRTGLVMVTSAIVSAGVAAMLFFYLTPGQQSNDVPALVGLQLSEALTKGRAHGFRLVVAGSINDSIVAKGAIASQTPVAGKNLPIGTRVIVKLSDGPMTDRPKPPTPAPVSPPPQAAPETPPTTPGANAATVAVPRVTGSRLSLARTVLQRAGLRVKVTYSADEDRVDGVVLSQRPASGEVERGTVVRLVVNDTTNL